MIAEFRTDGEAEEFWQGERDPWFDSVWGRRLPCHMEGCPRPSTQFASVVETHERTGMGSPSRFPPTCQWHYDMANHRRHVTLSSSPEGGHVHASVGAVHTHECGAWRMPGSRRHRPCSCGAQATWDHLMQSVTNDEELWELVSRLAPRP
jgi:hypothetical protein